ncbi:2695_t:CDS:2 [Entrophospora sp. SA101]|nr:2695_t:CDS:2 [Entrophospora sp. SA101]
MSTFNINSYEHEGFIEADEENEFNFHFKCNEHEEHEEHEEVVLRNNNSNHFPPPPPFSTLVHRYNLHNAIVKLPHGLELLSNLSPISIFMLFFTNEIFNQLVENSNSYAIKKGERLVSVKCP